MNDNCLGIKLPEELVQHIKEECMRIHHGRIIIDINASSKKLDVITESRERFRPSQADMPRYERAYSEN